MRSGGRARGCVESRSVGGSGIRWRSVLMLSLAMVRFTEEMRDGLIESELNVGIGRSHSMCIERECVLACVLRVCVSMCIESVCVSMCINKAYPYL